MNDKKAFKKLPFLAGVLGAQILLAGVLLWQGTSPTVPVNEPLLTLDQQAIDRVEIASDEELVILQRAEERWQLANGLPVESTRIEGLLQQLTELRTGWPVANSTSAHERFEVSEGQFQRRLTLNSGDQSLAKLYLGSSPGFRQVHARKEGDDAVYALSFDLYQAPADPDSWIDPLLARPQGEVRRIALGDFSLEPEEGQWPVLTAAETPAPIEHEESDTDASKSVALDVPALIQTLSDLRIMGLADQSSLDTADADEMVAESFELEVTTTEGVHTYELVRQENQHYLRLGQFDATFRLAKSQYDRLAKIHQWVVSGRG